MTVALARVFRLLLKGRERSNAVHHGENGVRKAPTSPEAKARYVLLDNVQDIKHRREGRARQRHTRNPWRTFVKFLLLLATYAGSLACGVFTAYLATDSKALLINPNCGLYVPASHSSQSQGALSTFAFQAQLESAQLAEPCYHATSGADGCNFFVQESIPYTSSAVPCPSIYGMCHEGTLPAIQFSTGSIDVATIGVNAP